MKNPAYFLSRHATKLSRSSKSGWVSWENGRIGEDSLVLELFSLYLGNLVE